MFVQQVINGLTIGSTYALVAVGFSMVFGVLELTNFAHSSVFMFGAYVMAATLANRVHPALAILFTIVVGGAIGIGIDRFALIHMRKRGAARSSYLICTIGISTFLQNLILLIFGAEALPFPALFVRGQIAIGNAVISYLQVFIICITLLLMVLTMLVVHKTKIGASMRSVAQNPTAARLMGVNVDLVITFTFFLGSVLATIAGIMVGMYYRSVDMTFGFTVGMKTFASAVLGGIGVLPGAVLGGLCIGVLESLFAGYISSGFKDAVAFILLIAVLLIRPVGLLGKKHVSKV